MRLSEAIRLGAMLRPQGRGMDSFHVNSCALIAACEAVGVPRTNKGVEQLYERVFPWAGESGAKCPRGCHLSDAYSVSGVIAHLNDTHRWTREEIADWVETLEREQDIKTSQPDLQSVVLG